MAWAFSATVAVYAGVTFPDVMGVRGYHSPRLIRGVQRLGLWHCSLLRGLGFKQACLPSEGPYGTP